MEKRQDKKDKTAGRPAVESKPNVKAKKVERKKNKEEQVVKNTGIGPEDRPGKINPGTDADAATG